MAQNIKTAITGLLTGKIKEFTIVWDKVRFGMPKRFICKTQISDGNVMITQFENDLATNESQKVFLPLPISMAQNYLNQVIANNNVSLEFN